jgi:hypothetical protein
MRLKTQQGKMKPAQERLGTSGLNYKYIKKYFQLSCAFMVIKNLLIPPLSRGVPLGGGILSNINTNFLGS